MSNAILKGKINAIFPAEIKGNFEKRVFWLSEEGVQYPNTWALECWQGDCNMLDNFRPGDIVTVNVVIRGRLWNSQGHDKVFNTIQAKKIELQGGQPVRQQYTPPPPSYQQQARPTVNTTKFEDTGEIDDAPF